jgi:hypothetical protein
MENESQQIQVDPRNIYYTCPLVNINNVQLPQEEYLGLLHLDKRLNLAQTHFCKPETTRNHPHENILVTWTNVKTL